LKAEDVSLLFTSGNGLLISIGLIRIKGWFPRECLLDRMKIDFTEEGDLNQADPLYMAPYIIGKKVSVSSLSPVRSFVFQSSINIIVDFHDLSGLNKNRLT